MTKYALQALYCLLLELVYDQQHQHIRQQTMSLLVALDNDDIPDELRQCRPRTRDERGKAKKSAA
jgi:hypothetical protein